jgi:hypothetical protein
MKRIASSSSCALWRVLGGASMLVLGMGFAAGPSGIIEFRVRDSTTGYAVRATVTVEGTKAGQLGPLSLRTNELGRFRRELPVGPYLVEVSAPGYESLKTQFEIGAVAPLPMTIVLPRQSLPEDLQPEVLDARLSPGHSLVQGYAVNAETGKPLPGVRIRLEKAQMQAVTNDRGYFWVSVPTPPLDALGLPGEDTLIAGLPGYKGYILQQFPGCRGRQRGVRVGSRAGKRRRGARRETQVKAPPRRAAGGCRIRLAFTKGPNCCQAMSGWECALRDSGPFRCSPCR